MTGKKYGILGGTFDPIHNGHIAIASQAIDQFALDRIIVIPTGNSYCKKGVTQATHRLAMVEEVCKQNELLIASDIEVYRQGNTYTIDTIHSLQNSYPDDTFYFIMGEDSLYSIEQWYNAKNLLKMVRFLVARRNTTDDSRCHEQIAYLSETYGAQIHMITMDEIPISSSYIRSSIATGIPVESSMPYGVMDYIQQHGLYN